MIMIHKYTMLVKSMALFCEDCEDTGLFLFFDHAEHGAVVCMLYFVFDTAVFTFDDIAVV